MNHKSIVCDEDSYLLELVRYVHLNPLRAGMVSDLDELESYPWSGHATIMGNGSTSGQAVKEVLNLFGKHTLEARRHYRRFIEDGIATDNRHDLIGKSRSAGEELNPAAPFQPDPRILGDSLFCENLRRHRELQGRISLREPIHDIMRHAAERFDVSLRALSSKSRQSRVMEARAMVCRLAVEAGHSGAEVSRHLGMTRSGVLATLKRGNPSLEEGERSQK